MSSAAFLTSGRILRNSLRKLSQYPAQQRNITTKSAKSMLGLHIDRKPTVKELRHAYFEKAKECHPDVASSAELDFLEITEAYEYLLQNKHHTSQDYIVSLDEEETYRQACVDFLGIPAEIVEESKQNPMFRHWLGGNTDAAQHWRSFFAVHGGLALKLRPPAGFLEGGGSNQSNLERRPKRRR